MPAFCHRCYIVVATLLQRSRALRAAARQWRIDRFRARPCWIRQCQSWRISLLLRGLASPLLCIRHDPSLPFYRYGVLTAHGGYVARKLLIFRIYGCLIVRDKFINLAREESVLAADTMYPKIIIMSRDVHVTCVNRLLTIFDT
eukprot:SAG31_NODE_1254_length_9087_cov_12.553071_8_plen_144_part_00